MLKAGFDSTELAIFEPGTASWFCATTKENAMYFKKLQETKPCSISHIYNHYYLEKEKLEILTPYIVSRVISGSW